MTLAEQFRQEGREEGRRESEVRSRLRSLLLVLEARFGDIPVGLVEKLTAISDVPTLVNLLKGAAVCQDLEAFSSNC
jgi:hypothetical protein